MQATILLTRENSECTEPQVFVWKRRPVRGRASGGKVAQWRLGLLSCKHHRDQPGLSVLLSPPASPSSWWFVHPHHLLIIQSWIEILSVKCLEPWFVLPHDLHVFVHWFAYIGTTALIVSNYCALNPSERASQPFNQIVFLVGGHGFRIASEVSL